MKRSFRRLTAFLLAGALAACATPAPPLAADQTAVIRGRETAGLSQADASTAVLVEAARITVDHGFQYFRIVHGQAGMIRPGTDVTIQALRSDSVRPGMPGLWDAQMILIKGVSAVARQPTSPPQKPRCTAYGCAW